MVAKTCAILTEFAAEAISKAAVAARHGWQHRPGLEYERRFAFCILT
jgi:hypothetical protein